MRTGSNYTRVAAGQTDAAIESEQTITVYGIVATNAGAATAAILIEESDGSTLIQTIQVPAGDSVPVMFANGQLFDNGMNVTTPADCTCTVYHSHGGS